MNTTTTLWKQLWDHDPNGLLVLDEQLNILVVNPAFCRMWRTTADALIGQPGAAVLGELEEFQQALATGRKVMGGEREFPRLDLYVRTLIFPIPAEKIVAGIFVDMTAEWKQERELNRLKQEAVQEVRQVVDKQMRVAQEIAGLLGETTAETKVSLLRLLEMLGKEKG
jgi:PAS domain S-box-containing protein